MNLTSSVLFQSDKLVVGPHLPLPPASAAVVQVRFRKGCIISRRHARLMEEQLFDHHGVVLNEIVGLVTCRRGCFLPRSVRRSTDLHRYNLQVNIRSKGGLDDGRTEGRTGVQVERMESRVVVSCEENNKEGACDMPCEDAMFKRGTQRFIHASACLEPHEKNHVCGSVEMHVRVFITLSQVFSTLQIATST